MLNRSRLTFLALALCALPLTACVQNRTFGAGVDDFQSEVSLKSKLFDDEKYDYGDVDVTAYEGRILLTGTMRTEEGKYHAERLAQKSTNVVEVLNELQVGERTSFQQGTNDAWIDQRLALALRADNAVYKSNYQIAVSGGTVYLLGVAQGPNELRRVTDHARNTGGVKRVISHVLYVGDPRRATREGAAPVNEPAAAPQELRPQAPTQ